VLTSDNTKAESFAGFLDQVESEHFVQVLVIGETRQRLVTVDCQTDHTGRLPQHLRRPLVRHFAAEIFAVSLDKQAQTQTGSRRSTRNVALHGGFVGQGGELITENSKTFSELCANVLGSKHLQNVSQHFSTTVYRSGIVHACCDIGHAKKLTRKTFKKLIKIEKIDKHLVIRSAKILVMIN